jgi:hypothetical protein
MLSHLIQQEMTECLAIIRIQQQPPVVNIRLQLGIQPFPRLRPCGRQDIFLLLLLILLLVLGCGLFLRNSLYIGLGVFVCSGRGRDLDSRLGSWWVDGVAMPWPVRRS